MFKGSLVSLAVVLALTVAPAAHARHATTHHHHYARHRVAQPGYVQPAQTGQQQGHDVCRRDAIRLCKPVLAQGNMAVLGCFRSHAGGLSRGCRALLQSYGQI